MARVGLKYLKVAELDTDTSSAAPTYKTATIKELAKMVSLKITVNTAEGELYANDSLAEYLSEFSSADVSCEVDNVTQEDLAWIHGATYDSQNKVTTYSPNDAAPYIGMAGYQRLVVAGVPKFVGWMIKKVKFAFKGIEGNTRGSSISFNTKTLEGKAECPNYGGWFVQAGEFTTEADAKTWVDGAFGTVTPGGGSSGSGTP